MKTSTNRAKLICNLVLSIGLLSWMILASGIKWSREHPRLAAVQAVDTARVSPRAVMGRGGNRALRPSSVAPASVSENGQVTLAKQTQAAVAAPQPDLEADIASLKPSAVASNFTLTPETPLGIVREREGAGREHARYDQPAEAVEYYRLKRLPEGESELPVERYLEAQEQMRQMPQYSTAQERFLPSRAEMRNDLEQLALGTWAPLGPGNIGGRTRALLVHPTNPSIMYAAGVADGVWKTTNGGTLWAPIADLIANIAVNSLAMDPKDPNVIYAGTGEGYFNFGFVRGAGIFKTTDGGVSWTRLVSTGTANFYFVNDIVISPTSSQRVYAATRTGVWRSLDGGASWTQVLDPAGSSGTTVTGGCLDLAIKTDQTTDYIFAACGTLTQATIYRNTDAGGSGTWTAVHTESGMGRTSLAIASSNQNVIYAASASISSGNYQDGLHAVFRSTNSGDAGTWTAQVRNTNATKLNTMLFTNPWGAFYGDCGFTPSGSNIFANQGWFDNVIAVDPLDANRVWVGGIDLFRSDDAGQNWGLASYWWADGSVASRAPQYAHADQHAIVFHPQYNGTTNKVMFVGNDGGIFRTDDARATVATGSTAACSPSNGGVTWTALNNNYGVTQFYHGAPYPNGTTYFGGTQDNGTVRGTDASGINQWSEILGGDGGYVAVDPTNTNILYAENTRLSHKKSTDGGATFFSVTSGIYENSRNFLFIAPFIMDPSDPQRLWTGGAYLWRTTNGAVNWTQASALTAGDGLVSAIAVAPTDANFVLAGMTQGEILRTNIGLTTDYNTSWSFARPRSGFVSWLNFDPTNKNIAYATYSSFNSSSTDRHIYKSTDAGATWTGIDGSGTTGIPDIPVHCLVVDPANTSRLYAGTDLGVFVSTDGGATWAVENTGFANVVTESLALNVVQGATSLFAFTHGRGAWRVSANTQGCNQTLSPTGQSFTPAGGTGSVSVTSDPASCTWTATSNVSWITVTSGASGTGNGTVNYTVAPSNTSSTRVGTLTIAGRSFTVTQAGCSFSVSPTSKSFTAAGGTDSVAVTASPTACTWTATSNASWITITAGSSGSGNGTVNYSVAANTGAFRTGTITVAGQTITITQLGDPSVCAVTPINIGQVVSGTLTTNDCNSPVRGSSYYADRYSFNGTAGQAVAIQLLPQSSYPDYLYLIGPNGVVVTEGFRIPSTGFFNLPASGTYLIEVTSSSTFRTGSYTLTLTAGTAGCSYTVTPTSQSFGASGTTGSVNVNAGSSCLWMAVSDSDWITVTAGSSGTGNGTVSLRVAANPSADPRSGRLFVAGQTITITQLGDPSSCIITPISIGQVVNDGDSGSCRSIVRGSSYYADRYSFSGTAGQAVAIQLQRPSSYPDYLYLIGPNGVVVTEGFRTPSTGFFSLPTSGTYLIEVTSTDTGRSGSYTLTLNGCSYTTSPASQSFDLSAGTGSIAVTTTSTCPWTATSNASWITITAGSSGTGNGTVNYSVAANTGSARTGTITVAGQTFTVTQAGMNPAPNLLGLNPVSAAAGDPGFKLTVTGSNFVNGAIVRWNGTDRQTTFVSATQLTAAIPASDLATAGTASVTVFNPAPGGGASTARNFTISANTRAVRVGASSAAPGSAATLLIELVSQGNENGVSFSLTFDPAALSSPQVTLGSGAAGASLTLNSSQTTQGRLGAAITQPPGQMFAVGTRQIAVVTFTIAAGASAGSTAVGFGDQPVPKEVSDASAGALSATFTAGQVTVTPGYEGDVAPRGNVNNNGTVTLIDFVQAGRFAASLDAAALGSEFQRADCAPRETRGDGIIGMADYVQAGRYAVGLDPVVPAGGPAGPSTTAQALTASLRAAFAQRSTADAVPRLVRAIIGRFERGQPITIIIELAALGHENALGFSLHFDPAQLRFLAASAARDADRATVQVNAGQAAAGRLGLTMILPPGETLTAGQRQLMVVTFAPVSDDQVRPVTLGFGDSPVARELVDVEANRLNALYALETATTQARALANVSAASFLGPELASEAIASAFGTGLATTTQVAETLPLPLELSGTRVVVRDSAGVERLAPLFFVSPGQVNYQIPPGTAIGTATVIITSGDGSVSTGIAQIAEAAPGLFTVNADGQGLAAAVVVRVGADGSQQYEPVARFDPAQNKYVAMPIDLGAESDQVYLLLFGTGLRHHRAPADVAVSIGDVNAPVSYAGEQSSFVGLDQVNVLLPRSLSGRGEVDIVLTVDSKTANTVKVNIR
jgi:uncharacterized protein (TIGR03437 family)